MEELDVIASEEMPMFLVGLISRLEGVSYCMDGAQYLIHTVQGLERVRAANEKAREFLDEVAGSRLRVIIIGRFVIGPEVGCHYFSANEARPFEDLVGAFEGMPAMADRVTKNDDGTITIQATLTEAEFAELITLVDRLEADDANKGAFGGGNDYCITCTQGPNSGHRKTVHVGNSFFAKIKAIQFCGINGFSLTKGKCH